MNKIIAFLLSLFVSLSVAHAASDNQQVQNARLPDVKHVVPADAPDKVASVVLISILSENGLTQIVSTGDKKAGPYGFVMQPPEGSTEGVDLLDILTCLKKVNPFATPSNQGLYLKNFGGQWHYVGLNITSLRLEDTPIIEHRCD